MKKLLVMITALLCARATNAQTTNCCLPASKNDAMVAMLKSESFVAAHDTPEPFAYKTERGSMVTFNTLDGKTTNAFYVPSTDPTNKVLLIFHEWWGLNDYIKREAVRWQDMLGNIDVYAVDLFDGKVATTPEEARNLSAGMDKKRGELIVKGAVLLGGRNKLVGTLGWCFGGSYSFDAAVAAGDRANGCVMYYGFPETDPKQMKALQTDVVYVWGSKDQSITKNLVNNFGKAIEANGRDFTLYTYDAAHAFANPSNPKHDAVAAADAEKKAVAFLKKQLAIH